MSQLAIKNEIEFDPTLRMYAIFRADIFNDIPDQTKYLKIASQTGHAFKMLTRGLHHNPELNDAYFADGMGTNIILKAKNLGAIERALQEAKDAGLYTTLITDEHHIIPGTAFDGNPIITCLGIGPARRDEIQHITRRFSASM